MIWTFEMNIYYYYYILFEGIHFIKNYGQIVVHCMNPICWSEGHLKASLSVLENYPCIFIVIKCHYKITVIRLNSACMCYCTSWGYVKAWISQLQFAPPKFRVKCKKKEEIFTCKCRFPQSLHVFYTGWICNNELLL